MGGGKVGRKAHVDVGAVGCDHGDEEGNLLRC